MLKKSCINPGFSHLNALSSIPHHLGMNYYVNFLGRLSSNGFQLKKFGISMVIKKIKILEAVLEQLAKQHCQSRNWAKLEVLFSLQLKTAPRILIFSNAMGAEYSFEVKNIEIQVPAFFQHNNSSVATVILLQLSLKNRGILQNK